MPTPTTIAFASLACSLALVACGAAPVFPADFQTSYREVRDCRRSGDHDLNYVRVLTDPTSFETYKARSSPFAEGAVVLKAEFADAACTDPTGFTAMRREKGFAPQGGDWRWQKLDKDRAVLQDGAVLRCQGCHAPCQAPPLSHDWTCAEP